MIIDAASEIPPHRTIVGRIPIKAFVIKEVWLFDCAHVETMNSRHCAVERSGSGLLRSHDKEVNKHHDRFRKSSGTNWSRMRIENRSSTSSPDFKASETTRLQHKPNLGSARHKALPLPLRPSCLRRHIETKRYWARFDNLPIEKPRKQLRPTCDAVAPPDGMRPH